MKGKDEGPERKKKLNVWYVATFYLLEALSCTFWEFEIRMFNSLLFIIFATAIKRRTELNKKQGPTVDKSGEVKGSSQGSKKTQRSDFVKSTKVSSISLLCMCL